MHDTRALTSHLADLLRREHAALGDFLVALAAFDRERRWVELGYTSLFYFLHRELRLSKSAAYYRKTAAELIQRYPEIVEPLRQGTLCLSTVAELAKVITPENRREVVGRFLHASKEEARAVVAELCPTEAPPQRDVVTATSTAAARIASSPTLDTLDAAPKPYASNLVLPANHSPGGRSAAAAHEAREKASAALPHDDAEPLTADLRRLHITVSKRFLDKLAAARDALSHSHPGATTEDVLEAALDLLLARDAKRKALVEKPRPAPPRPSESARYIPAEVKRAVWERDGGRCQWKVVTGGVCGSTTRLELDHVVPVARGGASTIDNLRVTCGFHNQLAARQLFGEAWMDGVLENARLAKHRSRKAKAPRAKAGDEPPPYGR